MAEDQPVTTNNATKPARPESTISATHTSTSVKVGSTQTPVTAHPTAIIADKASLTGRHAIRIGEGTVIHPYAKLDSSAGAIEIGDGCVIWERAQIGGGKDESNTANEPEKAEDAADGKVTLESNVTVGPHAKVARATYIGACTSIDVGASVSARCRIGEWCKLSALTTLEVGTLLDDFTVVFYVDDVQRHRTNVSARDFERVRALEAKGKAKEREASARALGLAKAAIANKGK